MKRSIFILATLIISLTAVACGESDTSQTGESSSTFDTTENSESYTTSETPSTGETTISDTTTTNAGYEYTYIEPSYSGDYYASINESLRGDSLTLTLDSLLDSRANTTFTYNTLWNVFPYTDCEPSNPKPWTASINTSTDKIVSFYSGNVSLKGSMNREHTWPNSRGGNYIEKDPHMVRPTIVQENSDRGNDFFNESPKKWDPATFGNYKYRGIAARIIFYCAVKQRENLSLVDKDTETNWNTYKTMGKLSTLLKWNLEYPIDDTELLRNDVLFGKFNHCRNPFIDNANYACMIWGEVNDTTRAVCGRK